MKCCMVKASTGLAALRYIAACSTHDTIITIANERSLRVGHHRSIIAPTTPGAKEALDLLFPGFLFTYLSFCHYSFNKYLSACFVFMN